MYSWRPNYLNLQVQKISMVVFYTNDIPGISNISFMFTIKKLLNTIY